MHKFQGFDFLRAIFSLAIVADHTGLFELANIYGTSTATNLLYANFSYISVPVFFQISLFLFQLKSGRVVFKTFFQNRIAKLICLYLFWLTSFVLFRLLFKEGSARIDKLRSLSIKEWIEFIISGGNSPFYFFFSLIFLTILTALLVLVFKKVKNFSARIKISYWLLVISCIVVFASSIVDRIPNNIYPTPQITSIATKITNIVQWNYNPLNFLPYIFTAAIVVQEFERGKFTQMNRLFKFELWSLFFLFLIFTLLEWSLLERLMHYSRLSLIFGSWLLLELALLSKLRVPALVSFISEYSLGLYAFHLFFTHVILADNPNFLSRLSELIPGLEILAEFLLVISGALALTFVFKQTSCLKKLV
jgi:Acyltransferase family